MNKVKVSKNQFQKLVESVNFILEKTKDNSNLDMKIDNSTITLIGQNSDGTVTSRMAIENTEDLIKDDQKHEINCALIGASLLNGIKLIKSDDLTIEFNDTNHELTLQGKAKRNKVTFATHKATKVIPTPEIGETQIILGNKAMKYSMLHKLLSYTAIAASKNPNQPNMCGVRLRVTENGITAVGTDGHRCHQRLLKLGKEEIFIFDSTKKRPEPITATELESIKKKDYLVSAAAIQIGSKIFSKGDWEVMASLNDRQLTIEGRHEGITIMFLARTIQGNYPDIDKVLELARGRNDLMIKVSKENFKNEIDNCRMFSGTDNGSHKTTFVFSKGSNIVSISMKNSSRTNSYESEMELLNESPADIKFVFNNQYFVDMKEQFEEIICLHFAHELGPVLVQYSSDEAQPVNMCVGIRDN